MSTLPETSDENYKTSQPLPPIYETKVFIPLYLNVHSKVIE